MRVEIDKQTIQQVLGSLMLKPTYLDAVDRYSLSELDFPDNFEKGVFHSIQYLRKTGATKIQPIDIENQMMSVPGMKTIFERQNGIEYLQDIIEIANVDAFPSYYLRLKKLNLLIDLNKSGFDVSDFYCDDPTNPKAADISFAFQSTDAKGIVSEVKEKLLHLESKYEINGDVETEEASKGIDEFIKELGNGEEIGFPLQGNIFSKIVDGARKGTLMIRSAASGVGKTRNAMADACYLAYPFRYNSQTCEWEQKGNCERVLFIVTEQQFSEARKMILAYLTDINESHFKYNDFSDRERQVISQAVELMKKYQDNLILVKMPNPTIEIVKTKIREECITHDIGYVFYDYIFIGPALLGEFHGFNLRNDEVLLMFATALKDLAVELDVAIFTSTQLNAKGDYSGEIRNEGTLAGGRSTINKADVGAILARPTPEELDKIKSFIAQHDNITPNLVTDIFKVRSGAWTQVRIWSQMNLGTLKKTDLFITDAALEPVENFFDTNYNIKSWQDPEDEHMRVLLEKLNKGEPID